jgi:hypothetical protein
MVVGASGLSKMATSSTRMRMMGWLAILSCVPLAVAQAIGGPLAVGLAGLIGLTAAIMLAVSWTQLHGHLPPAQQIEAEES